MDNELDWKKILQFSVDNLDVIHVSVSHFRMCKLNNLDFLSSFSIPTHLNSKGDILTTDHLKLLSILDVDRTEQFFFLLISQLHGTLKLNLIIIKVSTPTFNLNFLLKNFTFNTCMSITQGP